MKCAVCKGDVEERLIRYVQEIDGRIVIVENVPAELCLACGERYIRSDIAEKIQRVVWDANSPSRRDEVPVYDLAASG